MQPTPHLSKVIPRKDLPRIYTMYLPPSALKGAAAKSAPSSAPPEAGAAASSLAHALAELSGARDEVLHAVRSAPERRVDNLITRAHDAAAMLRVHALVLEEVRRSYTQLRVGYAALTASLMASSPLAAYLTWHQLDSMQAASVGAAVLALAAGAAAMRGRAVLNSTHAELASDVGLDGLFEKLFATEVSERDEFVRSLWRRARPSLQSALAATHLPTMPAVSVDDLKALDDILSQKVPELRRLTSHAAQSGGGGGTNAKASVAHVD